MASPIPFDPPVTSVRLWVRKAPGTAWKLVEEVSGNPGTRSLTLPVYGKRFRYGHYVRVGSFAKLAALGVGVGSVFGLAQLPPTRKLLVSAVKDSQGFPGER